MTEACLPCHINFTLVGRFETLTQDAGQVLRALGLTGTLRFPQPRVGELRESAGHRTRMMFAQLLPEDVERLRALYRQDFELFGYDPHAY